MRLLFSAPVDFDDRVWKEYQEAFEICSDLPDGNLDAWVCDPSASIMIDDNRLSYFPNLKILATPSTGSNHIDMDAVKRRGIKFISLLDDRVGLETISASAEFTFHLLLAALRLKPGRELQGKRVGLVGYGRIGQRAARWCREFGARTYVYDAPKDIGNDLPWIFRSCDAVVICCSLTPETRGMIGYDLLSRMKQGATLVNTARAEIIDEAALLRFLSERPDIRFATDVVHGEVEGRAQESRDALKALGAIVTPHVAGNTFDSRTKAARIILGLLKKELAPETHEAWPSPGQGVQDAEGTSAR